MASTELVAPVVSDVYLERIDQARNMARYYRLSVMESLFGEWVMVREWGRIGSRGQSREHCCTSPEQAASLLEAHRTQRVRRGYR
ncbi:MAG: WGR domain-containing protein [Hyphomicrobium zavarzinii]|uniref:WGR domain-containing protein n=1 Tax=Hyphomicrobium zavarzinii TaxID=48292 RepID=UPI001A50D542|nr:WGR domain-containing protein [Hyphomicrobium zavarzinii]MBL8845612.1 WGR domain-containing protein [Hyphomicrobium zavarzinii]